MLLLNKAVIARNRAAERWYHCSAPSAAGGGGSSRKATLTLSAFARELAGTAYSFGLLPGLLLGGLLVVVAQLHFAEDALALKLLFQRTQRLIDIVIANNYLQAEPPFVRPKSGLS